MRCKGLAEDYIGPVPLDMGNLQSEVPTLKLGHLRFSDSHTQENVINNWCRVE